MNKHPKIIIPIPTYGFDPTEVAIPWKILTDKGFQITFATPHAEKAQADKLMLTGQKLGLLKKSLMARKDALAAYSLMLKSDVFNTPLKYEDINESDFDAIYLPGGHDKGVKEYLESKVLQKLIPQFFENNKKVAAICHGVILLARSINPITNKSVIHDYKTTSLLKSQERLAYHLTKLWLKDYYLTYPETTVEDEVKSYLKSPLQFIHGPKPIFRDSMDNQKHGFYVQDRNYLSARWPGDIHAFTLRFAHMLDKKY